MQTDRYNVNRTAREIERLNQEVADLQRRLSYPERVAVKVVEVKPD